MADRCQPARLDLLPSVCAGILVTGDTQDLTIGECVTAAGSNCGLMVRFPTAWGVVIAASVPAKYPIAAIIPMSTGRPAAFTSAAGSLPRRSDNSTRKCHRADASFLRWKLTKRQRNAIMNLLVRAPGKPSDLPRGRRQCQLTTAFVFLWKA